MYLPVNTLLTSAHMSAGPEEHLPGADQAHHALGLANLQLRALLGLFSLPLEPLDVDVDSVPVNDQKNGEEGVGNHGDECKIAIIDEEDEAGCKHHS